jgi:hypothetical protein
VLATERMKPLLHNDRRRARSAVVSLAIKALPYSERLLSLSNVLTLRIMKLYVQSKCKVEVHPITCHEGAEGE